MSLDFYITNVASQGDWMMEGNRFARMWWEIAGPLRFVEIPLWVGLVFCATYIVHSRYKFLAIFWLNILAFNHLLGFMTWLPYGTLDFLYFLDEWAVGFAITFLSILLSALLTLLQALPFYSQSFRKQVRYPHEAYRK